MFSRNLIFWLQEPTVFVSFEFSQKHVMAAIFSEGIALGGASVSMAVSATIAAEALCGEPGLGQLAWKAALARDLPLLVTLTLLIAALTLFCNRAARHVGSGSERHRMKTRRFQARTRRALHYALAFSSQHLPRLYWQASLLLPVTRLSSGKIQALPPRRGFHWEPTI